MREPDSSRFTQRLSAAAAALSALARAPWRRSAQASADGLSYNNRNDGPPDLDELWRDFNRKLSGLFGARAVARTGRIQVVTARAAAAHSSRT
jgi:membrane protease subunit HflK